MADHDPVALRALEERVAKIEAFDDTRFYFVCGMPISDIGKGTFVGHLLSLLPGSDALKFDGLLNTNANGRHTAPGHDDFGIYERCNGDRRFGDERFLLGGYLFTEFIDTYGECENLSFRPHFYLFVVAKILEIWREIGEPKHLVVEIGGTLVDYEVDAYIPPVIQYFKQRFGGRSTNILMSELGWNGTYVKTRSIQRAVEECAKRFCAPDVVLAREPMHMPACSIEQRRHTEAVIHDQIRKRMACEVPVEHIVSVPFVEGGALESIGAFYATRCQQFFDTKQVVCIGSGNASKVSDWRSYLGDEFYVVEPEALRLQVEVSEGRDSLCANAERKAVAWARASGCIAVSDDTGFFIDRLGGLPGVSVKTWANTFERELSNAEFMAHLKEQLQGIDDTSASIDTVVAVATPSGKVLSRAFRTKGRLDPSKLAKAEERGYPLANVFVADGREKTWASMSADERRSWDDDVIGWVKETVRAVHGDGAADPTYE